MTPVESQVVMFKNTMLRLLKNFNSSELKIISKDSETQFSPSIKLVLTEKEIVLKERLLGDERVRLLDFGTSEVKENTASMGLNSYKSLSLRQLYIFTQTIDLVFQQASKNNMVLICR
jgi:hypothetical protein